eukprot:scaffold8936_cov61-Phaeocystis_antarctica.AAC.11
MKAQSPMLVRPSGRLVSTREVQPSKALLPMQVRLAGRVIETRDAQPLKASSGSSISPSGTVACPCASMGKRGRSPCPYTRASAALAASATSASSLPSLACKNASTLSKVWPSGSGSA